MTIQYAEGFNLDALIHNINNIIKSQNITIIGNPFYVKPEQNLFLLYKIMQEPSGGKSRVRKGYKTYMKKTRKRN